MASYLDDERALARGSQHIVDESRWAKEMDTTREACGHNEPSRAGAKVTYGYHQIIAFNPDECSMNGGKMTPERGMEFAREWAEGRYPNQEAAWVLHEERCPANGTGRYAVHLFLNRTDLETGKRLAEGRGERAKAERARAMREMDERWGLRQLERGKRNSRVHAMQPTRAEREMAKRGVEPDKAYIRQRVRERVPEIAREEPAGSRMRELSRRFEADGVEMSASADSKRLFFRREGSRARRKGHAMSRLVGADCRDVIRDGDGREHWEDTAKGASGALRPWTPARASATCPGRQWRAGRSSGRESEPRGARGHRPKAVRRPLWGRRSGGRAGERSALQQPSWATEQILR